MKTLSKIPALLVTLILLSGCEWGISPGSQDFHTHLAGDYFLNRTSAFAASISPESYPGHTPIIPIHVVECGTDGRFIIAKRQVLERRSPNDANDTLMIPDEGNFDFWILDTDRPKVYGPLTLSEFDAKKTELLVNSAIKLQDIYKFRPKEKNKNQSIPTTN